MWTMLALALLTILALLLHADGWNNVLSPARNELVFAGRHQAYGAYRLRRDHQRVMALAVAVTGALVAALVLLPRLFAPHGAAAAPPRTTGIIVELEKFTAQGVKPAQTTVKTTRSTPAAPRSQGQGFVPVAVDSVAHAPADTASTPTSGTTGSGTPTDSSATGAPSGGGGCTGTGSTPDGPMGMMAVEEVPLYPGGMEALYRDLGRWVEYPEIDRTAGREGRVLVGFVVDEEGRVGEVRVINGVSRTLDAEAVRVVKRMPRWKPGRHGGQAVAVFYVLPINFKLGRN